MKLESACNYIIAFYLALYVSLSRAFLWKCIFRRETVTSLGF